MAAPVADRVATPGSPGADPVLSALLDRIDAQDARIARLEASVARLAAAPGADRDAGGAALLRVLVESTEGACFTAAKLLRHAEVDDALRAALVAELLETTGEIGAWLRDRRGTRNGITVERLKKRQWRVHVDTSPVEREHVAGSAP